MSSYYESLFNDTSSQLELEQVDKGFPLNNSLFNLRNVEDAIAQCNFAKGLGPDMFDGSILKD